MIACIGETLEQREAGTTVDVVAAQTKAIAGTDFISEKLIVHFFPKSNFIGL